MPRRLNNPRLRGAIPPRTVAFCRGAMSVVLAALGMTALVLMLAGLLTVQTMRPGFSQVTERPAAVLDGAARPSLPTLPALPAQ